MSQDGDEPAKRLFLTATAAPIEQAARRIVFLQGSIPPKLSVIRITVRARVSKQSG